MGAAVLTGIAAGPGEVKRVLPTPEKGGLTERRPYNLQSSRT